MAFIKEYHLGLQISAFFRISSSQYFISQDFIRKNMDANGSGSYKTAIFNNAFFRPYKLYCFKISFVRLFAGCENYLQPSLNIYTSFPQF